MNDPSLPETINVATGPQTALVLTGGGARAAYQVGALQAILAILDPHKSARFTNPFPVVCGSSAGAINATAYACRSAHPHAALKRLEKIWRSLHTGHVYRSDPVRSEERRVGRSGGRRVAR